MRPILSFFSDQSTQAESANHTSNGNKLSISARQSSRTKLLKLASWLTISLLCLILVQPSLGVPYPVPNLKYIEQVKKEPAQGMRELHFIPHTHMDPMWMTPLDVVVGRYVHPVYNSITDELHSNERHRFMLAETCFIKEYLNGSSEEYKTKFLALLRNGRMGVQGGGIVMHDEACPYFDEMIMNLSYGRLYLQSLGVKLPTVAWMIDTFGHGTTNMRIHSQMGYRSIVLTRIDFNIKDLLRTNNDLMMNWTLPSNPNYSMLVHELGYFYMVVQPFSFFESYTGIREHLFPKTNILNEDFNLNSVINHYVQELKKSEIGSPTRYILSPFGGDNNFRHAHATFRLIDMITIFIKCNKFIYELDPFISDLDEYYDLVQSENLSLSKISQDFFPVVDDFDRSKDNGRVHTSWTGYFTTNPGYKHRSDSYTRNVRALMAMAAVNLAKNQNKTELLELHKALQESVFFASLLSNHDTITATSKDSVLGHASHKITRDLENLANHLLNAMLAGEVQHSGNQNITHHWLVNKDPESNNGRSKDFNLILHQLKTLSHVQLGPANKPRQVMILNPLSPKPHGLVRLISHKDKNIEFPGATWKYATCIKHDFCESVFWLQGSTPIGQVSQLTGNDELIYGHSNKINPNQGYTIPLGASSSVYFKLNEDGNLKFVDTRGNEINVGMFRYGDAPSNVGNTAVSGKYIFSTNEKGTRIPISLEHCEYNISPDLKALSVVLAYFEGSFKLELKFIDSAPRGQQLTIRYLIDGITERASGSYTVRISTGIKGKKFVTDSNGLEEVEREPMTDQTVFVDTEYYPVTKFIYLQNDEKRFTVITDRSEGGAFTSGNEIELMLHRISHTDDGKGVMEGERSSERVSILHYLIFEDRGSTDGRLYRAVQTEQDYHTMVLELPGNMFTISNTTSSIWGANTTSADGGNKSWPSEFLRVTFERSYYSNDTFCRLVYLHDSTPLTVDVGNLIKDFYSINVQSVEEWTLDMTNPKKCNGEAKLCNGSSVNLVPLDIRTFKIILAGST
jgi:hypothetical protein